MTMNIKVIFTLSLICNLVFGFWVVKKFMTGSHDDGLLTESQQVYWNDKVSQFEILNKRQKHRIILAGDSMIDRFNAMEFMDDLGVCNRGIGNETTETMLSRFDNTVLNAGADVAVLYIGGNDLSKNILIDDIVNHIDAMMNKLNDHKIFTYVLSVLPRAEQYAYRKGEDKLNDMNQHIGLLNRRLERLCRNRRSVYCDITKSFTSDQGMLKVELSNDGTHLNGKGYVIFEKELRRILKRN